ncbi:MAG: hypothetical protein KKC46_14125 [Proteobacteria bacterium]|nr:hypothetical protein [Pseudomonadota bacterium]
MAIASPIVESSTDYKASAGQFSLQALSFSEVNINPDGYAVEISWQNTDGLTKAIVSGALFYIKSVSRELQLGEVFHSFSESNLDCIITFDSMTRLKKLAIADLEVFTGIDSNDGYESVASRNDLSSRGLKIVLSIPDGRGGFTPIYSSPAPPARAVLPSALIECSFSNGVLSVADIFVETVRLNIVKKDQPEDFEPVLFRCSTITGVAANLPADVKLVAPNGETIWTFPNEFEQAAPVMIDFRLPLQAALNEALGNNQELNIVFLLKSSNEAAVKITQPIISGELCHIIDGVNRTELCGEALEVSLEKVLPFETPDEANADLSVTYNGIRILEQASDDIPLKTGDFSGKILDSNAFLYKLPPVCSNGFPIARIAVIGRAPVPCELEIQPGTLSGQTLFTPSCPGVVLKIEPAQKLHAIWADFAGVTLSPCPDALSVKALSGRFFWVFDPHPLIRVAVFDPDPKGSPLFVDDIQILAIEETTIHLPATSLPKGPFCKTNPVLYSSLFCTVDLSDIKLRYNR